MHYAGIGLMKAKWVSHLGSFGALECGKSAFCRREIGAGIAFRRELGLVQFVARAAAVENAKLAGAGLDDAHLCLLR